MILISYIKGDYYALVLEVPEGFLLSDLEALLHDGRITSFGDILAEQVNLTVNGITVLFLSADFT